MSNIFYPVIVWLCSAYKSLERTLIRIFHSRVEELVKTRMKIADIIINGNRPWDIKVHKKDFYTRLACDATLGIGESKCCTNPEVEIII